VKGSAASGVDPTGSRRTPRRRAELQALLLHSVGTRDPRDIPVSQVHPDLPVCPGLPPLQAPPLSLGVRPEASAWDRPGATSTASTAFVWHGPSRPAAVHTRQRASKAQREGRCRAATARAAAQRPPGSCVDNVRPSGGPALSDNRPEPPVRPEVPSKPSSPALTEVEV
jgi:hypothetical protein